MPTINVKTTDLEWLAGMRLGAAELEARLPLVKGELKGRAAASGELHLELNDTNRPDLWSVEGIARQFRLAAGRDTNYPFFHGKQRPQARVQVDAALRPIRPYLGACIATGIAITDETLRQLIQVQEKLSENFGRRRQIVSIGLYRLAEITFPVRYTAADPDAARFVPLGFDQPLSLRAILAQHPKGQAYGGIIAGHDRFPLLIDARERILSLPPIINSRELGEVQIGDRDLFVEVTGTDLRMVALTVNILAANLADRGARIAPVETRYPYPTTLGRNVRLPRTLAPPVTIAVDAFERALGEAVAVPELKRVLGRYGYQVQARGRRLRVAAPPYRDDLMHPIDVVEDFAISRGYASFEPRLPSEFTIGGLTPQEGCSDQVRELLIGLQFQEIISNILTAKDDLQPRMRQTAAVVEVENVMAQTYSCLRNSLLPSLLRVEAASSKSFFPHRIFEVGEVALPVNGAEPATRLHAAALIAHADASFSELHSAFDLLLHYLGRAYSLEPIEHPSFIDGRAGRIVIDGVDIGVIGELHPQVLEQWQAIMPAVAFELHLDPLLP